MRTTTLPQRYCPNQADHPTHVEWSTVRTPIAGSTVGAVRDVMRPQFRCPGRHTPSLHRAPHPAPATPSDPFAGIDENTEYDATRPGAS